MHEAAVCEVPVQAVASNIVMTRSATRGRIISVNAAVYRWLRLRVGSRLQIAAKTDWLHNHYPRGDGLATSPGRRARLRFHSPEWSET
jgi:hypothetical protein